MKKTFGWGLSLAVIVMVAATACAQVPCADKAEGASVAGGSAAAEAVSAEVKAVDAGNKVCPVMGGPVVQDPAASYEYEGKVYHFCCPACVEAFKKNPAPYIQKVEEEVKAATPAVSDPQAAQ